MNVLDTDDFAHYQATGGCECPHCGSRNLEWKEDVITVANGTAFQEVKCADCLSTWIDHYTLTCVELPHELQTGTPSRDDP